MHTETATRPATGRRGYASQFAWYLLAAIATALLVGFTSTAHAGIVAGAAVLVGTWLVVGLTMYTNRQPR